MCDFLIYTSEGGYRQLKKTLTLKSHLLESLSSRAKLLLSQLKEQQQAFLVKNVLGNMMGHHVLGTQRVSRDAASWWIQQMQCLLHVIALLADQT